MHGTYSMWLFSVFQTETGRGGCPRRQKWPKERKCSGMSICEKDVNISAQFVFNYSLLFRMSGRGHLLLLEICNLLSFSVFKTACLFSIVTFTVTLVPFHA